MIYIILVLDNLLSELAYKTCTDYGHTHWRLLFEKGYYIEYFLKFGFISDVVETYNIFYYPCTPTYTSYFKIY